MRRVRTLGLAVGVLVSGCQTTPRVSPAEARLRQWKVLLSEQRALVRLGQRECEDATRLFEGALEVNGSTYVQTVLRDGVPVDEPIARLDEVVSTSRPVQLHIDYPFERRFTVTLEGELTLRRAIDGIRGGLRKMYADSQVEDLPGIENKHVTGPWGESFHDISDLVIESIDLCRDDSLLLFIGS